MNQALLQSALPPDPRHQPAIPARPDIARTGVYFLLAVVTSLFFLLCIALLVRAQYPDWESLTEPWQPLARPWWLWFNSAVLVLASAAMQWACLAARRRNRAATINRTLLAGVLSSVFVAGQIRVWQLLYGYGITVEGNPANSFFFLITGLHGLHILGGLVAWGYVLLSAHRVSMQQLQARVQLCATYWHYLLGIWLLLLVLLTSSTQTYRAIASFCGF